MMFFRKYLQSNGEYNVILTIDIKCGIIFINKDKKALFIMNMDDIWSFIEEKADFFKKISKRDDVVIDFDNHIYTIDERWFIDPFYLILFIFRKKFEESGPSSDYEFTRMSKVAYKHGVKFPFGKKEYDNYIASEVSNQGVLYVLEEHLRAENNKFIIPTKEYAESTFKNVSNVIEDILSGIFMYENREARYYIDLYDRLAGFEIFLDNGSIFIPSKDRGIKRPTLFEDRLRSVDTSSKIEIYDMSLLSDDMLSEGRVFVSSEAPESVSNISKYFRTFDIVSEDNFYPLRILESLYTYATNEISITINGELAIDFVINYVISAYLKNKVSSIPYIVDIVKCISVMPTVDKDIFINGLKADIPSDIISVLNPYLDGNTDSHESKILKMIGSANIELCARVIRGNGDSSSIVFYNKQMKYFKEFTIDKQGIINDFIPDLGGFRFISNYCDIDRDKVPQGYSNIDTYIASLVSRVIHREFGSLPLLSGSRSSGVHFINNTPIFGHSDGVYGLNGKHSIDGILIEDSPIEIKIPKRKATKKQAALSIGEIVEASKGFITSDSEEYKYFAIMIASSLIIPLLRKSNKFVATIVGADRYIEDGLKYKLFKGVFRNSRIINTDSDFVIKKIVDGSSSILVTEYNKSIKNTITVIARERLGSEHLTRLRGSDMIRKTVNTSPLLLFTDKEIIIDDSVIFNFRPRVSNVSDSRLYSYEDESGTIASYVFANMKKLLSLEEYYIDKAKKIVKSSKIVDKNSYIDFFEKILPAMCLVEITGYMKGIRFHDDMMSIFFNTSRIRKSIKIDKMILGLTDGQNKVEDKVFDHMLRSNQAGDLVFVDKILHRSNIELDNSDTFVFIFNTVEVFEAIRKDVDISYIEFLEALSASDGYINYDNGIRNWKMLNDKNATVFRMYKEYFNGPKDNFGAIRMQKKAILSI